MRVLTLAVAAFAALVLSNSAPTNAITPAPTALNNNATVDFGDDRAPQIATDSLGNWVAVWQSFDSLGATIGTDADIVVARSTDAGATWTALAALNTDAATDTAVDSEPQAATDGLGNWVAVWSSNNDLGSTTGADRDILVARSTDAGATWTAPAALNTNATTDSGADSEPQVITNGLGDWVAIWSSTDSLTGTIGADKDILVSTSIDNGATWSAPAALNSNAATDVGIDEAPQIGTDGAGKWVTVWQSTGTLGGAIGGDNDVLVSVSANNGATWSSAAALNTNASGDAAGDFDPQVATDGLKWVAVWRSEDTLSGTIGADSDILVARSTDSGVTWTAPAALNTNATTDTGGDFEPVVAVDGANWVVLWTSDEDLGGIGTDYDGLTSLSTNAGVSWTAPAALAANAGTDSGSDFSPQTASDGAGNWVTAWSSNDTLGGTIGTDYDIVYVSCPPVSADADGDGLGDFCDSEGPSPNTNGLAGADDCADGVDNDGDTLVDGAEPACDGDGDGVAFIVDNCPVIANSTQADGDIDGVGDACDNCPATPNAGQVDADGDTIGNACDTEGPSPNTSGLASADDCTDGVDNDADTLVDGAELACDGDGDGVAFIVDNCPVIANSTQADGDLDSVGDACDNCPATPNAGQEDIDADTIGDVCDDSDIDAYTDHKELFMGTDYLTKCPATGIADLIDNNGDTVVDEPTEGANDEITDAWPPDFDDNQTVNILDVLAMKPVFNSTSGDGTYLDRDDLTADGNINVVDVLGLKPVFNTSCI